MDFLNEIFERNNSKTIDKLDSKNLKFFRKKVNKISRKIFNNIGAQKVDIFTIN